MENVLLDGENRLQATASSRTQIESWPAEYSIAHKKKLLSKPDAYYLVIGLSQYKNSRYNLNYGSSDAEAFSKLLKQQTKNLFNQIHLVTLNDNQAEKNSILLELRKIAEAAKPEDVFVMFYAGHGVMI